MSSILVGARTLEQLDDNLSSLNVMLSDKELLELDELTTPSLNFPADFLHTMALDRQQAGRTINGIPSKCYVPK